MNKLIIPILLLLASCDKSQDLKPEVTNKTQLQNQRTITCHPDSSTIDTVYTIGFPTPNQTRIQVFIIQWFGGQVFEIDTTATWIIQNGNPIYPH